MDGMLIFYFGLDFIKGTLVDDDGKYISSEERELELIVNEEFVEQQPGKWYDAVVDIIKTIQSSYDDICINSMTVTYQPGTYVCVDRDGKPLMNAIMPCDRRAKYQIHLCEKIIKRYGNGYYIPWNLMTLPRLLWLKYNKTDVYKRIFKVLTPDGYISYRLSGESAIDSYSALLMGCNPETMEYDSKLIDTLELDRSIFPVVRKAGESIGVIAGEAREALGLKSDMNIIMASNCFLPIASEAGCIAKGTALYDFESSAICYWSEDSRIKCARDMVKISFGGKCYYFLSGNYEKHFFKWIEKFLDHPDMDDYNTMTGVRGLIVLPYIMGDSRLYGSDIKGAIMGIGNSDARDIMAASYESLGYIIKERIELLSECGLQVEKIELICNFKDKLFYRIMSDIVSKNVIMNNNNDIYVGVLFNMLTGKKVFNSEEGEEIIPDEGRSINYRQLYNLYRNTVDSLTGIYKYRRKILRKINS